MQMIKAYDNTVECRYNAVQYISIYHWSNWGTISIRASTKEDTLTGELWGAFREYFWENWPRFIGTALYFLDKERW